MGTGWGPESRGRDVWVGAGENLELQNAVNMLFYYFVFYCGKIHVTEELPSSAFLSVLFSSVKYTHTALQTIHPQNSFQLAKLELCTTKH